MSGGWTFPDALGRIEACARLSLPPLLDDYSVVARTADNLVRVLERVETVMTLVVLRSQSKEYRETLAKVHAALTKARGK